MKSFLFEDFKQHCKYGVPGRKDLLIVFSHFREDASGKMQTRFLLVTVENFLRNTIIVQDNR